MPFRNRRESPKFAAPYKWDISSVGLERHLDRVEVTGSKSPINTHFSFKIILKSDNKSDNRMNHTSPRIVKDLNGRLYIEFYLQGKRKRLANGKKLGIPIHPNRAADHEKVAMANKLLFEIQTRLESGEIQPTECATSLLTAISKIDYGVNYRQTYLRSIEATIRRFVQYLKTERLNDLALDKVSTANCIAFLHSVEFTPSSFNRERKHISSLLNRVMKPLGLKNPVESIPVMKETPLLHKPFKDVSALLEEMRSCNENLFLCCLITYGCLLRPHQEIRQLTWGDFSEDLSTISLSGKRNKSGRNRIVPVPSYITQHLEKG